MLKQISFLLGCSKKHIGIYVSSFAAILGIFLMYFINVEIQNYSQNHSLESTTSGLVMGDYQQIVMYLLNGFSILYFVLFVYKSPKQEGYELVIFSKKTSRLSLIMSRLIISVGFVICLTSIETIFLLIPARIDEVMESGASDNWLLSLFFGNIIAGLILLSGFIFFSTIMNYISSIILNTSLLISFPIISILIYSVNSPNTEELDKYDSTSYGFYNDQRLTIDNVMPIVENDELVFPNLSFKRLDRRIVRVKGYASDNDTVFLNDVIKKYNSQLTYGKFIKMDGWNAFKNYFSLFNEKKYHTNHKYRIYKNYKTTEINDFYKGVPESAFIRYRDGLDQIEITKKLDANHILRKRFLSRYGDFKPKNTSEIQKIIRDTISALDTDDALAEKYRRIPGHIFWQNLLNFYDPRKETLNEFLMPYVPTELDNYRQAYKRGFDGQLVFEDPTYVSGFFLDKMMKTKNPLRYNVLSEKWINPTNNSIFNDSKYKNDRIRIYREGLHDNKEPAITVEDGEFETETPWTAFLPSIAFALLVGSVLVFMRRDIK